MYQLSLRSESAPLTLLLRFDRRLYERLWNQHGAPAVESCRSFYRLGETAWMPMYGQVVAPGVGHSSNSMSETRWSEGMIKVLCESPSTLPQVTRVTLAITGIGRQWHGRLGNFGNPTSVPQWAWLSPLDRAKTFFNISDPRTRRYPYYMEVPLDIPTKRAIPSLQNPDRLHGGRLRVPRRGTGGQSGAASIRTLVKADSESEKKNMGWTAVLFETAEKLDTNRPLRFARRTILIVAE